MFIENYIENYLKSYIIYHFDKNHIELTIDEARSLAFGKACMFFTEQDTGSVACCFSDRELETPHPNPLQADSDGVFPEYFTIPNTRLLIQNNKGEQLLEHNIYAVAIEPDRLDITQSEPIPELNDI